MTTTSSATHRALALPELLRNILFSLPNDVDSYHAALVCRNWSEFALDALWYDVEDICVLLNLLVPLIKATADPDSHREFARCPRPQDWVQFEKYSHRVRKLTIEGSSELPAQSVFDDIARSRIQHTVLPNLWSLRWLHNAFYCVPFLHSGIRDLAVWINVNIPAQTEVFMQNARFYCRNVVLLEIQTGSDSGADPHPVGCVVAELSDWLAQLHNLREVILPRFWATTRIYQVLSQLTELTSLGFKYTLGSHGNPLDTIQFDPIFDSVADPGPFPSLLKLSQTTPFSKMIPLITSWHGSSRISDLWIDSQILESPNSYRSLLNAIGDSCPLLCDLTLSCLMTPYQDHPQGIVPSEARIKLDVLLPLHKLANLQYLSITHTLPLALTDDDFLIFISKLPNVKVLHLVSDVWPSDLEEILSMEAPLSTLDPTATTIYPVPGLWKSMKSLSRHCPHLEYLAIFGLDDFPGDQVSSSDTDDEPEVLPFANLTSLSFGSSLISSDNAHIAFALSQYVLPTVKLNLGVQWGGDEASEYLTYLNLHPLIPIRDELCLDLQDLIGSADLELPNAASAEAFPTLTVDEPVGVNGLVDKYTETMLDESAKQAAEINRLLKLMARARLDERKKAERRLSKFKA